MRGKDTGRMGMGSTITARLIFYDTVRPLETRNTFYHTIEEV